jgi:UDP-N-acetylmuramate--alanine ligase
MVAWMLQSLGLDPSYIIGGDSVNLGNNAQAGKGPYFVIEADEYDHMFLGLNPAMAVVTNIEHDHPDCYPNPEDFYQAFFAFSQRLEPDGILLACADDAGAARLLNESAHAGKRTQPYGLNNLAGAYFAQNWQPNLVGGFSFDAYRPDGTQIGPVVLQVPGVHNVLNALAALAVADLLGLRLDDARQALGRFLGTGRRFQLRGEATGVRFYDDYAHHPTEIRATLAAARALFPQGKLWAVWQPHTYSRTRTLQGEFINAFADADRVIVTEVFAAREAPPQDGFSARQLAEKINAAEVFFAENLSAAQDILLERVRPGDLVLVLSAGDADQIGGQVLDGLRKRAEEVQL